MVAGVVVVAMTQIALGGQRPQYSTATVQAGQSLWSIAAAHYPQTDPRQSVLAIQQANHLAGGRVYPGEVLRLPALPGS